MIRFPFLKFFKHIERIQIDQCIQIDPYICKLGTREEEGIHRAAPGQSYHTSHSMDGSMGPLVTLGLNRSIQSVSILSHLANEASIPPQLKYDFFLRWSSNGPISSASKLEVDRCSVTGFWDRGTCKCENSLVKTKWPLIEIQVNGNMELCTYHQPDTGTESHESEIGLSITHGLLAL